MFFERESVHGDFAEINNMITNYGKGNHELSNLPRKINLALSPSRDDFPHVFINDVGLQAVRHPETGEVPPHSQPAHS